MSRLVLVCLAFFGPLLACNSGTLTVPGGGGGTAGEGGGSGARRFGGEREPSSSRRLPMPMGRPASAAASSGVRLGPTVYSPMVSTPAMLTACSSSEPLPAAQERVSKPGCGAAAAAGRRGHAQQGLVRLRDPHLAELWPFVVCRILCHRGACKGFSLVLVNFLIVFPNAKSFGRHREGSKEFGGRGGAEPPRPRARAAGFFIFCAKA